MLLVNDKDETDKKNFNDKSTIYLIVSIIK